MEVDRERLIKLFNERKSISCKSLEKMFGMEVSHLLAEMVDEDLVVVDQLTIIFKPKYNA